VSAAASPPPPSCEPASDKDPVLALIAKIKEKTLEPRVLAADDRRRCVEFLRGEGCSVAEMAQILKRDERTIARDLAAIRAANAFTPTPHFSEQMTGELLRQADVSVSRLRRIARESTASAMERLMAEAAAWKVYKEAIDKLQSLGHLPRVPTTVVAGFLADQHADPIATYQELEERLAGLERVDAELGMVNPERSSHCDQLRDEIRRAQIALRIERLDQPEAG